MTWQEMIEAAQLDALGLLDEQERERFDAAFLKLPADLKAQLRSEQDRVVRFEVAEEGEIEAPPASLKNLVLAAVKTAAAQSQTVEHKSGRNVRPMRKSVISPMWRAGALGLVAACLVMGAVIVNLTSEVQKLDEQARGIALSDAWRGQFSRRTSDIAFDHNTVHKIFAANKGFNGKAAVYGNPSWENEAQFHFESSGFALATGQHLKVVILDGQGKPEKDLLTFDPEGGRTFKQLAVSVSQLSKLAIVLVEASGAETVVMTMKA